MVLSSRKIPVGVPDFDTIVKGGFPEGAVVLLRGEIGAGQNEFVYTALYKICAVKQNPQYATHFLGHYGSSSAIPEKICYITFSRSKEHILREIYESFEYDVYNYIRRNVEFKDFSKSYFGSTKVPTSWTADEPSSPFGGGTQGDLLTDLIEYLDNNARNALVIIDSLTDLVLSKAVDMGDLIGVLKGIQRVAKYWSGLIYLMLTDGIIGDMEQQMVVDSVDGVMVFQWSNHLRSSKRQRYVYVEKFTTVLSHVDMNSIARFPVMITDKGMSIITTERI